MVKILSLRVVVRIIAAIIFSTAFYLALKKYSANMRPFHQTDKEKRVADESERVPFEKVRTSNDEHNYYRSVPKLPNLNLSRDVLKTERTNREIETELSGGGQRLVDSLRKLKYEVDFQENRLLHKVHKSATLTQNKGNISNADSCVIKVLQLCKNKCTRIIKERDKIWTKFSCKFSNCRFETKVGHTLLDIQESDVVFVLPDEGRDWKAIIESRPKGQLWVFHSKEAPIHGPEQSPPHHLGNPFNISITYMSETDIAPAYYYLDTEHADPHPTIPRKKKLMSWMSSNCNNTSWKRAHFVQELQRHLAIDTYGLCGRLECPRTEDGCWSIRGDYKFYLALENSQCPEYITEKFWHNALAVGSVPIVFGPSREDYERLAPPHSYIHVEDFRTVQEFADYIHLLDRDDHLYLEYFSWRRLGTVQKSSSILTTRIQTPRRLCFVIMTLLKKSLHPEEYPWQDQHPNFHDWWHGLCREETQKRRIMDIDV